MNSRLRVRCPMLPLCCWKSTGPLHEAVHAGEKQTETGKSMGRFTLQDFGQWTDRPLYA